MQKQYVSSDSHLQTGHQWSDQSSFFLGTLSLQFQGQCSHLFEASSGSCGSTGHGCSLVIMELTSSTGGGSVSTRQFPGCGSELSTASEKELKGLNFA